MAFEMPDFGDSEKKPEAKKLHGEVFAMPPAIEKPAESVVFLKKSQPTKTNTPKTKFRLPEQFKAGVIFPAAIGLVLALLLLAYWMRSPAPAKPAPVSIEKPAEVKVETPKPAEPAVAEVKKEETPQPAPAEASEPVKATPVPPVSKLAPVQKSVSQQPRQVTPAKRSIDAELDALIKESKRK